MLIYQGERLRALLKTEQEVRVHLGPDHQVSFEHAQQNILTVEACMVPIPSTDLWGLKLLQFTSSYQALHDAAYTDLLTGLGNRRAFEEALKHFAQQEAPLALVILDLDGLKAFNDLHGHAQGDAFLKLVAVALQSQLRTGDRAYRIGGDEFALILQGLEAAEVHVVFEAMQEIRTQLRSSPFRGGDISAGVAFHPRESAGDARILTRLADERMYEQKRSRGKSDHGHLVGTINRHAVIRGMGATLDVLLAKQVPGPEYWQLMLDYAIQMVPSAQAGSLDLWDGQAFIKVAQLGFEDDILGLELSPQAQLIWYGSSREQWMNGVPRILREVPTISSTSFFSAEVSGDPDRIEVFEESGRLGEIQCTLNAPITHQGKVYGHLNLDNFVSNQAFNKDSLQVTVELIRLCATVCYNLNLPAYLP
ncbi:GGDEF domain-containing protein [Deinococcus cellulosilyticus]|nr:GGDEF domain-containing protein [Deinococcus cellulosilyticus]